MEGRRREDGSGHGRAGLGLWRRVSSVGPGDRAEAGPLGAPLLLQAGRWGWNWWVRSLCVCPEDLKVNLTHRRA